VVLLLVGRTELMRNLLMGSWRVQVEPDNLFSVVLLAACMLLGSQL
jgi:hypothetical protein